MPDDYLMPVISEAEFPRLLTIMKGEGSFPSTYDRWQATWEIRRKQEEGSGFEVQFVEVRPAGFASFCRTRDIPANWQGLFLYIMAKAGRSRASSD